MKLFLKYLPLFFIAAVILAACQSEDNDPPEMWMLRITAETNRPDSRTYIQDSTSTDFIRLIIREVSVPFPGESFTVNYKITNIFDNVILEDSHTFYTDKNITNLRTWTRQIPIDKSNLGYFSFTAFIKDGPALRIPVQGTRPRDYINYAVFMNPNQRIKKAAHDHQDVDKYIFSGMYLSPWGEIDGYNFNEILGTDTSTSGQFQWNAAFNTGAATDVNKIDLWIAEPWRASTIRQNMYILGELTAYMPAWSRTPAGRLGMYGGELSTQGEIEFVKYIEGIAKIHIAAAPVRPYHYYQILWEPVDWWNAWTPSGDPGDRAIVKMYQLAYEAIHRVYAEHAQVHGNNRQNGGLWTKTAVVLGPTYSDAAHRQRTLDWHKRQFDLGLAYYIDGLSLHPYNDPGGTNNILGTYDDSFFADTVKALMEMTRYYYDERTSEKHFDKPFFWATELGLREAVLGPVIQAQVLARQNVVMLGEGFDANQMFCFADYNFDQSYGYFYNHENMLTPLEMWAPGKVSPKMTASAFAAATHLLKSYVTAGKDEGLTGRLDLGGNNWGYKLTDTESNDIIYALWNYERSGTDTITISVGAQQVIVYDIVGNAEVVQSPGGNLTITLSEWIQYVKVAESFP